MLWTCDRYSFFPSHDVAENEVASLKTVEFLPAECRPGNFATKKYALEEAPHPVLRVVQFGINCYSPPSQRCDFGYGFPLSATRELMECGAEPGLEFVLLFILQLFGAGEAGFDGVPVGDETLLLHQRRQRDAMGEDHIWVDSLSSVAKARRLTCQYVPHRWPPEICEEVPWQQAP